MNEKNGNKTGLLIIIILSITFYFLLRNFSIIIESAAYLLSVLFPFLFGGAIAFVLNIPMKTFEKKLKMKRMLAFLLTLLLFFAVIFLVMFIVIPELISTVNSLITQIPKAFYTVQAWVEDLDDTLPAMLTITESMNINWSKISEEAVSLLQSAGSGILNSTFSIVSGIASAVLTFFVGFTFSIYALFQKEKLSIQVQKILYAFLSEKKSKRVIEIGRLTSDTFEHFLSGQCVEAMILGLMFFISMSIFRLPYALLTGVVIAVTALIPVFGAFIGLVIGSFLIVMVSPIQALGFVVLFFVLQQIEGNLIYPRVVGGSVGLPSIWVLAAVTIGGKLFGVAGMFLFIPVCSVLYALFREFVFDRLKQKKIPQTIWSIEQDKKDFVEEAE